MTTDGGMGWDALEGDAWVEARHRMYGDGTDVIVSIHRSPTGFEVRSSAESRTSGPCDAVVGAFATIEEAREAMRTECAEWDVHLTSIA